MDSGTLVNFLLVLFFVLVGGVFAGTEMALVSLRESQIRQIERPVMDRLGRLPQTGDRVEVSAHVLTVIAMDRLRIGRIRVTPV